jgi:hypothetical protein
VKNMEPASSQTNPLEKTTLPAVTSSLSGSTNSFSKKNDPVKKSITNSNSEDDNGKQEDKLSKIAVSCLNESKDSISKKDSSQKRKITGNTSNAEDSSTEETKINIDDCIKQLGESIKPNKAEVTLIKTTDPAAPTISAQPLQSLPHRSTTVAHMQQTNPYVAALPSYMLKHPSTVITAAETQAHSVGQAILYLGVPSSTIPALAKNPLQFGIGFGIGAAAGALAHGISTAQITQEGHIWHWLERSAAMNNLFKGAIAALHSGIITANMVAGLVTSDKSYFPIFEGVIAGAIVGYEGLAATLNVFKQATTTDTPAASPV